MEGDAEGGERADSPPRTGDSRVSPRRLPGATVLQIVPTLSDDDLGRTTIEAAFALLRAGARAMVAGPDGPLVGKLQGFGGEWIRFEGETRNPLNLRSNSRILQDLIASERIDLVHAHGVGASRSAAEAKAATGIFLVHSCEGALPAAGWRDKAYVRALLQGDGVIAPSAFLAVQLADRHGIARQRLIVIPRRVDTAWFDPTAVADNRIATLRQAWRIRSSYRVMLVPGRVEPAKGQLMLVDAVRMLVNGGLRGVAFVLAGNDKAHSDYARAITEHAAAQGLAGHIRRVGWCDDMPAAYTAADAVVIPAIAPPAFPRAAAEAMAMARPVVAAASGALPEFVLAPPQVAEDARTGWLADPEDATDLARALAAAASVDAGQRRAIGARGRRLAESTFSPEQVTATLLAVYTSLLEGNR
jgi:glycosyltransferase involved in cell wall biosynthesis